MICEKCKKRNATVLYTQIINGHKQTMNVCSECASGESIFDNIGSLLGFDGYGAAHTLRCPVCNMTLAEFTRGGKMGCGECYRTFRPQAEAVLRKIHGSTHHINAGQYTKKEEKGTPADELSSLKSELQRAIECENFEEAARLRDKIRAMGEEKK